MDRVHAVQIATETFEKAGVGDIVTVVPGDVREHLPGQRDVAFCFLDTEKNLYEECYEAVVPNMVSGGLLVSTLGLMLLSGYLLYFIGSELWLSVMRALHSLVGAAGVAFAAAHVVLGVKALARKDSARG